MPPGLEYNNTCVGDGGLRLVLSDGEFSLNTILIKSEACGIRTRVGKLKCLIYGIGHFLFGNPAT